ncbi:MAG: hypothetical protein IPM35_05610 [Myxococcales bacterium]|nr:hypothetical protein [Myxococcales bacterium]
MPSSRPANGQSVRLESTCSPPMTPCSSAPLSSPRGIDPSAVSSSPLTSAAHAEGFDVVLPAE